MKKLILVAALTFATGPIIIDPVFAADEGSYCQSQGIADAGYQLTISPDQSSAQLTEETFMGLRKVATLSCQPLMTIQLFAPDAIQNYLACRGVSPAGDPLVARVFAGGFAGLHYASLRTIVSVNGMPKEQELRFGHMVCRR